MKDHRMTQIDLSPILTAVRQAADLTRRVAAEGFDASSKQDDSPVTIADYGAQALISRAIQAHFPDDAVIAEESGGAFRSLVSSGSRARVAQLVSAVLDDTISETQVIEWLDYGQDRPATGRAWVIDPIDGTIGFVKGRYYAVCVGYMIDGVPTGAVIGLPRSPIDEAGSLVYTTGEQVFVTPLDQDEPRPVQVSERTDPTNMLALDSTKIPEDELSLNGEIRDLAGLGGAGIELYDSQLKYTMIAAGYADLFVRLPRDTHTDPHYIWDHAPGAALVQAAGGQITDVRGRPLDFNQGKTLPHLGFIASNGPHHHALVGAMRERLGHVWGF
jgi:HAL2 family 3'(2'),5'-bisphosphate nucleotidase